MSDAWGRAGKTPPMALANRLHHVAAAAQLHYLYPMRQFALITAVAASLTATQTTAHPHLFVGVDVTVIYQDGAPAGVQLNWSYDDFFSLVLTSDLGIDLDGDLQLTDAELTTLTAAVADWPADFGGDLEVTQNGQKLRLGGRAAHQVTYEGGLVREAHIRPLPAGLDPTVPLVIQVYDPFYYVSYSLNGPVRIAGRADCNAVVIPPDLNAAYSEVDEQLYGRPASDVGPEEDFPEVGVLFAETITVTCAG